ncbi:hypothetical protein D8Y22_05520 [Salinadaptatus halalkaliphilus]|uniref:Uncharacterized protein n=1 Tax=Salinadaptatus halalkaliphilus TaxID=2419781 RepID=A0A4S3TNF0_9EURY|nr:hypothetical protein [Salinadaptatus halalkaliphilus]THE65844.1 hypothetical protein D8Y22_05520 [Salinadaptatus halalkaliphilus]
MTEIPPEATDLSEEQFRTAFAVLETAREWSAENGLEPERNAFNDAHHWLQEFEALLHNQGHLEEKQPHSVTEHAFTCSECGHEEWSTEEPTLGGNTCPNCGCGMTDAVSQQHD